MPGAPIQLTPEQIASAQPVAIQLTPEQIASAQPADQGVNPLHSFTPEQLVALQKQAPENFDVVQSFLSDPTAQKDPALRQKAEDTFHLLRQEPWYKDLPSAGQVLSNVGGIAKGFYKQGINYAGAASGAVALEAGKALGADEQSQREQVQDIQRKVATNWAGTETALTGLIHQVQQVASKVGRATHLIKPLEDYTPEDKSAAFEDALSNAKAIQAAAVGHGPLMQTVGGNVISDLEASKRGLNPQEVSEAAAGDPFSWYAFGKGLGGVNGLARAAIPEAAVNAVRGIAAAFPKAAAAPVIGLAAGTEALGKGIEKAAPVIGPVGGVAASLYHGAGPVGILGSLAYGTKVATRIGKTVETSGAAVKTAGKEIGGFAPTSNAYTQLGKDLLVAVPSAASHIGQGAAFDLGLAASADTPQEKQAVGLGTAFGILGAAGGTAKRAISGQLTAPHQFSGNQTFTPGTGTIPELENMTRAAFPQLTPGQKIRFNAFRDLLKGANPNADIFVSPNSEATIQTLTQLGYDQANAQRLGSQGGVTLDINGHRVAIVDIANFDSAPHEARHAMENVMGEHALRQLDEEIASTYGPKGMDALGREYTSRLAGTDVGPNWRATLQDITKTPLPPEQYVSREIAAEHFGTWLENLGGTDPNAKRQVPQVVASWLANVMRTFGVEPLAGQTSKTLGVPLSSRILESIGKQTRERLAETRPVIEPAAETAEATQPPATEQNAQAAANVAAGAPDAPLPGATQSPREILGTAAEAIANKSAIKINHLSAPEEPAASTTSDRTVRRYMQEFFRTMPQAARKLWEKTFFPERVNKLKKGGYQVEGWSPEVFAANAHKMANFLAETGITDKSPFAIDPATKTFTPEEWQRLYDTTAKVVANQQAGRTGSGIPLEVPQSMVEKGFYKPPLRQGTGKVDQREADFISMLFNYRLPDTAKLGHGKFPLNVAGQEISKATLPGRIEAPAIPKPSYGEAAVKKFPELKGRQILEVNPVRNEIENAALAKNKPMPSMIEARQKLNLENILQAEHAPEAPEFRGNTLTLSAGFAPKQTVELAGPNGEKVKAWFDGFMDFSSIGRGRIPQFTLQEDAPGIGTKHSTFMGPTVDKAGYKYELPATAQFAPNVSIEQEPEPAKFKYFQPHRASGYPVFQVEGEHYYANVRKLYEAGKPLSREALQEFRDSLEKQPVHIRIRALARFLTDDVGMGPFDEFEAERNPSEVTTAFNDLLSSSPSEKEGPLREYLKSSATRFKKVGAPLSDKDKTPEELRDEMAKYRAQLRPQAQFAPADEEKKTFIVRHGSTEMNSTDPTKDLVRGHIDIPLDKKGRSEATEAAQQIADQGGVQHIIASDLGRTQETAQAIADKNGATVQLDPGLRPWHFGPTIEGHPTSEVQPEIQRLTENPDEKPPGGESFNEFKNRFLDAFHRAQQEHADKDTAIVTHYRGTKLLDAWRKTGVDNDTIDKAVFEQYDKSKKPGNIDVVDKTGAEFQQTKTTAQFSPTAENENRLKELAEFYGANAAKGGGSLFDKKAAQFLKDVLPSVSVDQNAAKADLEKYTGLGWVSPSGDIIPVRSMFEHLRGLSKYSPEIKSILSLFEKHGPTVAAAAQKAYDNSGEAFDWHEYETAPEDFRTRLDEALTDQLYRLGWVRTAQNKFTKQFGVEGTKEALAKQKKNIEDARVFSGMPEGSTQTKVRQPIEPGEQGSAQFAANKPVTGGRKSKQDYELKVGPGLFSKAWILPDGKPVQLGGQWHHEWLNENPDVAKKYGLKATTSGEENRVDALKKGFARVNYEKNTGTLKVEARAQDWPNLSASVKRLAETNLRKIDNMDVSLLDPKAEKVVEGDGVALHSYAPDEKMDHLPLITETTTPTISTSAQSSKEAQFSPDRFWLNKAGEVKDARGGHEEEAIRSFGVPQKISAGLDLDPDAVYQWMHNQGYLRGRWWGDTLFLTGSKPFSDIPKTQRNAIEDLAFDRNATVQYNDKTVIGQPRPSPQASAEKIGLEAGQFAPSDHPRALKAAAIQDPETGEMFEGPMHLMARDKALEAGKTDREILNWREGFVDNSGNFLNRKQAYVRAKELQQLRTEPAPGFTDEDLTAAQKSMHAFGLVSEAAQFAAPKFSEDTEKALKYGVERDEPLTVKIPLSRISVGQRQLDSARADFSRGASSQSEGNPTLAYDPRSGKIIVEDGLHRIQESADSGKKEIVADIHSAPTDYTAYEPYAQFATKFKSPDLDKELDKIRSGASAGQMSPQGSEAAQFAYNLKEGEEDYEWQDFGNDKIAPGQRVEANEGKPPDTTLEQLKKEGFKSFSIKSNGSFHGYRNWARFHKTDEGEFPLTEAGFSKASEQAAKEEKEALDMSFEDLYGSGQFAPAKFESPDLDKELKKIKSGKTVGQTFNPDGTVYQPKAKKLDVVTLASVNIPTGQLNREEIIKAAGPYGALLSNPNVKLGAFNFEQDGKPTTSIDINAIVPQKYRDNSLAFAKANDQVAIFDMKKNDVVPAGGAGNTRLTTPKQLAAALPFLLSGKPMDIEKILNPPLPQRAAEAERITPNIPSGAKPLPEVADTLNTETALKNPEMHDFVNEAVDRVVKQPGFFDIHEQEGTGIDKLPEVVRRMADNLKFLYNKSNVANRELWRKWYDIANELSYRLGKDFDIPHFIAAAVNARLSPQKDWYMNVTLTKKLLDTVRADPVWSKADKEFTKTVISNAETMRQEAQEEGATEGETEQNKRAKNEKRLAEIDKIPLGKRLSELSEKDASYLIRSHNELHGDKVIRDHNFERVKGAGKLTWQTYKALEDALHILRNPSLQTVDETLGSNHKVRSFYNNHVDPMNPTDVTVDTHAAAAAHLMPYGSKDTVTKENFGGIKHKNSGYNGTYFITADAYRLAAKELGLLPRELQSIVWEQQRSTLSPAGKRSPNAKERTAAIWAKAEIGAISFDEARNEIIDLWKDMSAKK